MANLWQKKYPPEEDYPDLSKHNNWMSKCLTPEIYAKLRDKVSSSNHSCIDAHFYQIEIDSTFTHSIYQR